MNTHVSKKINKGAVLALLAALSLLAVVGTALTGKPSLANAQEGRGRRAATTPRPEAQSEQPPTQDQNKPELFEEKLQEGQFTNSVFNPRIIRFDVAENGKRFTPDETPLFPDGLPAYGNEFVTEGYIYPPGTLNGANGVKPDGSPEFPDKVIGRWVCRGWHVGEGAHTERGPWVITHQLYDLGARPGQATIVTDGFELPEINTPINRAITGGTGPYAEARGEATQTLLGFNQTQGVVIRYEIRVVAR